MKIKQIDAYQVFDSRGNPTLEVEVVLSGGVKGCAIVPSGASTGRYEALELRDGDPSRFGGKSVFRAIEHVIEKIAPALAGMDAGDQGKVDRCMLDLDGTQNKNRLGANAIVGVSMAVARASANHRGIPLFRSLQAAGKEQGTLLPLPEIQLIGGGAHSAGRTDVQDFMIICTGAADYRHALEMTCNVYARCEELLKKIGKLAGVADEGGFWPDFDNHQEIFEVILEAIDMAGYQPGRDIHLALDIAASEFYSESDGHYHLQLEDRTLPGGDFYDLIAGWCESYPVISIEDPFAETDIGNWKRLTASHGESLQVIGDDLFTTDVERVRRGQSEKLANGVLIKLNQIGTVTETLECIRQTRSGGWSPVVSARSGETEDPFIAHLAVATNAGQLKVGSFTRSERMVKWNEVIRIERELGTDARFAGRSVLPPAANFNS